MAPAAVELLIVFHVVLCLLYASVPLSARHVSSPICACASAVQLVLCAIRHGLPLVLILDGSGSLGEGVIGWANYLHQPQAAPLAGFLVAVWLQITLYYRRWTTHRPVSVTVFVCRVVWRLASEMA